MRNLRIKIKNKQFLVELNQSLQSKELLKILPLRSKINLWGEEIYFYINKELKYEDLKEVVSIGDFAYWPEGPALCIFFGKTPISSKDEIKPASAVAILGKLKEFSQSVINELSDGDEIELL